jgi:hypothetical protein
MRVIAFIEDPDVIKKILHTWSYGTSSASPVRSPMARQLIYFPHMTSSRNPVLMIRLRSKTFGATGYIIDPQYPAEVYF